MDPVHFRQGKKVDLVQFRCRIQAGPLLAGEKSGPGPLLAGEKSGPGPLSAGEKSRPGPVSLPNPGRSTFGRGKKWTRSSFGPVSLLKSRQVHFWQGKKVDPVQFRSSFAAEIQAGPLLAGEKSGPGPLLAGEKSRPGPVSLPNPGRSTFGRGKKWTWSSFAAESRQVHFWQGKKVDPVQFRSSFAAEIQAGPLLAGEKSGPGPVLLPKSRQVHFWQGKKSGPKIQAGPFLARE